MEGLRNNIIPKQAISDRAKNTDWYKENIDGRISLLNSDNNSGLRTNREEKISNINLVNDIISKKEIQETINPYNLSGKFPNTYKNYPVINSSLNLLFGEERKRIFNPISYVVNSDIINTEQDIINDKFKAFLNKQVMDPNFNEEKSQKAIMNLEKWRKFTFQDVHTRMSNQVIQYFLNTTDIKEQWSKNFEDLLSQGEEIASIDIVGENLVFEKLNPLDVYTYGSGDSYKVEDATTIIIDRYMPIGTIIDGFHSYLTKENREYLEDFYLSKTSGSKLFPDGQLRSENFDINKTLEFTGLDGKSHNGSTLNSVSKDNYDEQGNIRVTRVLWKGQRKIGFLEFTDEDGSKQKKYVDEKYKADKDAGESVKWEYISEWYEGTRIASDIYVKYGPRPIQFRDSDNPSLCHPGIVGNLLNTNSSKAKSLVSYMKPYQLLYNFFMFRMQQDVIKYQGHIAKMNLTMKPDKWTTDKWMYYMQQFGIMYEDPFNEGQEGAATGKLAGGMGYNSGGSVQIGDFNLIQMNMMMLEFLENRMADISGVSPQRKGAVQNRETVGGVERSVMQSSNNTEKYYALHDNFRIRCLKVIVETAKIAWKDKKEKRTFILDDGTKSILDFDGGQFRDGSYGISTSSSSDVTNMVNELKQLAQPFLQNGGQMSSIIDVFQTKDPSSLKRKLEQYEEEASQKQQETEKRQQEMQQQQIQSAEQIRQAEMEHEKMLKQMDNDTKIQVELIKQENLNNSMMNEDDSLDYEKLEIQKQQLEAFKEKQLSDSNNKERQLSETERTNRAKEQIARQKPKN